MLDRLEREEDKLLLDIGIVFVEYAFDHYGGDLAWFYERMKNVKDFEDLPLLKGMLEKGLEQGLEQGREEGLEKGLKEEMASLASGAASCGGWSFPHAVSFGQRADSPDENVRDSQGCTHKS